MAEESLPLTNVGRGYTIVTQVIPSSATPAEVELNRSEVPNPLRKFLKGEPKALGAVQIMIGVWTILFGIVMLIYPPNISVLSGIVYWGSLCHIISGSLAVSASNKLNVCVVKCALWMNIFSAIAAGITIIILSIDLVFMQKRGCYSYNYYDGYHSRCTALSLSSGIVGVLLVFSLLQFTVSIAVSAFSCKATCTNEPTLNIINVVPNPERSAPVIKSFPADHTERSRQRII